MPCGQWTGDSPYSGDSAALCGRCPWLWVLECSPVGKPARARPSAWVVCICYWLSLALMAWGLRETCHCHSLQSMSAHNFPGLAGFQVNFTDRGREGEGTQSRAKLGKRKGATKSWEDGVERVAFRAGREVMSSHSSQRGGQPRVTPSWFDFIAGPGLATWVKLARARGTG